MLCSILLDVRDLRILRFWYPQGVLEPISCGHQGMTVVKYLESGKLYEIFLLQEMLVPLNPYIVQMSIVLSNLRI